jgi:hypothetical protein
MMELQSQQSDTQVANLTHHLYYSSCYVLTYSVLGVDVEKATQVEIHDLSGLHPGCTEPVLT